MISDIPNDINITWWLISVFVFIKLSPIAQYKSYITCILECWYNTRSIPGVIADDESDGGYYSLASGVVPAEDKDPAEDRDPPEDRGPSEDRGPPEYRDPPEERCSEDIYPTADRGSSEDRYPTEERKAPEEGDSSEDKDPTEDRGPTPATGPTKDGSSKSQSQM